MAFYYSSLNRLRQPGNSQQIIGEEAFKENSQAFMRNIKEISITTHTLHSLMKIFMIQDLLK